MKRSRKRVLRVRIGHLPNFSSGASYVACLFFLSAPISLVFGLITSWLIQAKCRALGMLEPPGLPEEYRESVPLNTFAAYARTHLICISIVTIFIGVLIAWTEIGIYGYESTIGLWYLTIGPFISWLLSTGLLLYLIYRCGVRTRHRVTAAVFHVVLLVICFMVGLADV